MRDCNPGFYLHIPQVSIKTEKNRGQCLIIRMESNKYDLTPLIGNYRRRVSWSVLLGDLFASILMTLTHYLEYQVQLTEQAAQVILATPGNTFPPE